MSKASWGAASAFAAWLVLLGAGFGALAAYSRRSGLSDAPPRRERIELPRSVNPGQYELILAVHPRCPCTQATATELGRILAATQDKLHVTALVYRPTSESDAFTETSLSSRLRSLPSTSVVIDPGGQIAASLRLFTSGGTVLYSPAGDPLFYGGITISRGHEGDNLGAAAVISHVSGDESGAARAMVYGCPITAPQHCSLASDASLEVAHE